MKHQIENEESVEEFLAENEEEIKEYTRSKLKKESFDTSYQIHSNLLHLLRYLIKQGYSWEMILWLLFGFPEEVFDEEIASKYANFLQNSRYNAENGDSNTHSINKNKLSSMNRAISHSTLPEIHQSIILLYSGIARLSPTLVCLHSQFLSANLIVIERLRMNGMGISPNFANTPGTIQYSNPSLPVTVYSVISSPNGQFTTTNTYSLPSKANLNPSVGNGIVPDDIGEYLSHPIFNAFSDPFDDPTRFHSQRDMYDMLNEIGSNQNSIPSDSNPKSGLSTKKTISNWGIACIVIECVICVASIGFNIYLYKQGYITSKQFWTNTITTLVLTALDIGITLGAVFGTGVLGAVCTSIATVMGVISLVLLPLALVSLYSFITNLIDFFRKPSLEFSEISIPEWYTAYKRNGGLRVGDEMTLGIHIKNTGGSEIETYALLVSPRLEGGFTGWALDGGRYSPGEEDDLHLPFLIDQVYTNYSVDVAIAGSYLSASGDWKTMVEDIQTLSLGPVLDANITEFHSHCTQSTWADNRSDVTFVRFSQNIDAFIGDKLEELYLPVEDYTCERDTLEISVKSEYPHDFTSLTLGGYSNFYPTTHSCINNAIIHYTIHPVAYPRAAWMNSDFKDSHHLKIRITLNNGYTTPYLYLTTTSLEDRDYVGSIILDKDFRNRGYDFSHVDLLAYDDIDKWIVALSQIQNGKYIENVEVAVHFDETWWLTCYLKVDQLTIEYTGVKNGISVNSFLIDRDGDTLTLADEIHYGTNPWNPDTDNDGIPDNEEVFVHHTNPLMEDTDLDYCKDGDEILNGTNPNLPDTDGDFLLDGLEITVFQTNALDWDTDGDYISDWYEIYHNGTDSSLNDTDHDGLSDLLELQWGFDPRNSIAPQLINATNPFDVPDGLPRLPELRIEQYSNDPYVNFRWNMEESYNLIVYYDDAPFDTLYNSTEAIPCSGQLAGGNFSLRLDDGLYYLRCMFVTDSTMINTLNQSYYTVLNPLYNSSIVSGWGTFDTPYRDLVGRYAIPNSDIMDDSQDITMRLVEDWYGPSDPYSTWFHAVQINDTNNETAHGFQIDVHQEEYPQDYFNPFSDYQNWAESPFDSGTIEFSIATNDSSKSWYFATVDWDGSEIFTVYTENSKFWIRTEYETYDTGILMQNNTFMDLKIEFVRGCYVNIYINGETIEEPIRLGYFDNVDQIQLYTKQTDENYTVLSDDLSFNKLDYPFMFS